MPIFLFEVIAIRPEGIVVFVLDFPAASECVNENETPGYRI